MGTVMRKETRKAVSRFALVNNSTGKLFVENTSRITENLKQKIIGVQKGIIKISYTDNSP
jgi:hypothetical protein